MERREIEKRTRIIFADLFGIPEDSITEESSADSIENWDSLQHLNLVTGVEEAFGVTLSDEDVVEMLSFGLVVEIVGAALARSTSSPD